MKIVPFDYMVQGDTAFCPKCSHVIEDSEKVERTICQGTIFGKAFGKCPKREHFHRQCPHCEGTWVEATFDNSSRGARTVLDSAFDCAEKADLSEDDIVGAWRNRQVRLVQES